MSKEILVVDDEKVITSALSVLLSGAGYKVIVAHSGEEAIDQLSMKEPDLIVLDIMMPGLDGYEVCRQVRQQREYTPILMLTAKDESWEKVTGLELGADVYMTKPFEPGELLAQVKALLRLAKQVRSYAEKGGDNNDKPLICDPLILYPQQHRILLNDKEVKLSPKEFELLHFFMQRPGRVFGRQTLLRQVWGYDHPDDSRTVDTHIQRLRVKIEADPTQPKLLQTVRGFGYQLVPPEVE
jgi:two-component system, OmpR family, alkaline phosphatase synthesis response regulator PhoP